MHDKEAHIVINGEELSFTEAMTLRLAITSALEYYSVPDCLGADEHGRAMTKHYKRSCENIQSYIFKNLNK